MGGDAGVTSVQIGTRGTPGSPPVVRDMTELNDFYNDGFGWVCRHCDREMAKPAQTGHSRVMREGEAESKDPRLANHALAKWADPAQRILVCPRCGITEPVEKS